MDLIFMKQLMDETKFPEDAKTELTQCAQVLINKEQEDRIDSSVDYFYENNCDIKMMDEIFQSLADESGVHRYSVEMIFLIECSRRLKEAFAEENIAPQLFWDTMEDLKYKANECKDVHGVWGTFVSGWYPIFFTRDIVKLDRLEYENYQYKHEKPYENHGVRLEKGDFLLNIHIPSSGSMSEGLLLESYKKAYDYFSKERKGGPLVCTCHSWLLFSPYKDVLSEKSNIVKFMNHFDIVTLEESPTFSDAWRIFGNKHEKPALELPEDTSIQKAMKKWTLDEKKFGCGEGYLVFDGEKILTK